MHRRDGTVLANCKASPIEEGMFGEASPIDRAGEGGNGSRVEVQWFLVMAVVEMLAKDRRRAVRPSE
jgi:hypothetical protein